ncbi:unnamed protein product [Ostreobium quekettii]|uniref:EamA domain-containing protein n=1 Tax=Ostreobium quekettii TaxID=121088 RepID=A0A8S1IJX5_9CHLO|nr:unnamed protein product [Ostreobium quekettii]|eukprot:evm.model.scf_2820.1 EVM.evm.TU.scf_2820.1   scf_2820:9725-12077(+)
MGPPRAASGREGLAAFDTEDQQLERLIDGMHGGEVEPPEAEAPGPDRVKQRAWRSGAGCVLLSASAYAFGALFAKVLGSEIPMLEVTALQAAIALIATLGLAYACDVSPIWGPRAKMPLLALRGLVGAGVFVLAYVGIVILPLGDALATFYTNPAFTALFTWLQGMERLNWQKGVGVAACMAGTALVAQPPFLFGGRVKWDTHRVLGICGSLSASIGVSIGLLLIVKIGKDVSPLTVTVWFHAATFCVAIVPTLVGYPQPAVATFSAVEGLLVVGIAGSMIAGQLLLTRGVQLSGATQAAVIRVSELVFGYAFGALFLDEVPTLVGSLGAVCIMAGVVLVTRSKMD